MIWNDINELATYIKRARTLHLDEFVCTSGGFDPIHVGHLRCIQGCVDHGDQVVVIVNGDGFLTRKKGFAFMPIGERLEIINAIRGVDHVIAWDDGSQFVSGALEILKPNSFAKGGDRSRPEDMAPSELEICRIVSCKILYGVGGSDKVQSSSDLVLRSTKANRLSQHK